MCPGSHRPQELVETVPEIHDIWSYIPRNHFWESDAPGAHAIVGCVRSPHILISRPKQPTNNFLFLVEPHCMPPNLLHTHEADTSPLTRNLVPLIFNLEELREKPFSLLLYPLANSYSNMSFFSLVEMIQQKKLVW
jgi:hypothetical protein